MPNNNEIKLEIGTFLAMTQLILYTTSHCHLCEQAEALLTGLKDQHKVYWQAIEISNDDLLTDKYGIRIPVIKCINNQAELNWPFSANDILKLIEA